MSRRKQTRVIQKAVKRLVKRIWKLSLSVTRDTTNWLVRSAIVTRRQGRHRTATGAGFVLPTVTMLLLVVALVIGAILFRTGSRTNQVIGLREEQVIYNAASPAIERAKAKLEYLFLEDTRRPSGAPSDEKLMELLLTPFPDGSDRYTLPNETKLDINNDGTLDPAWSYEVDVDGDNRPETVVYSILVRRRGDIQSARDVNIEDSRDIDKARALVVRNGPITTAELRNDQCRSLIRPQQQNQQTNVILPVNERDWETVSSASLRKTFQVNAIVISNKPGTSRTVATLEFQQDRQLDKANKWGAWFRYDLEIFPNDDFRWNGAMYTAGNLLVAPDRLFKAYLISSPNSCIYSRDASEITIAQEKEPGFQGQIGVGRVPANRWGIGTAPRFDLMKQDNSANENANDTTLTITKDSVIDGRKPPADLALDPVVLFTQDKSQAKNGSANNRDTREGVWANSLFVKSGRIFNKSEIPPYVDDTYRADNRYGPKPKYGTIELDNATRRNGQPIPAGETLLLNNSVDPVNDPDFRGLGLDGYWERRAWADGLRVIVGPRLELGNAFGWQGNNDPLYPVNQNAPHAQQQRRTLRDNLAAVQATVVYQSASGLGTPAGDVPIACVATTTHPGTQTTIDNSKNFNLPGARYSYPAQPRPFYSDFLTGLGTNGWEYTVHTPADFTNGPIRGALQNLANFAGDYENPTASGAFPPTQGNRVFPNPYLMMWGNFSNLKRSLLTPYNDLSIADKSYLHTAGCTLGMLAYNVNHYEQYNYNHASAGNLNTALAARMDGDSATPDVLDTAALKTYRDNNFPNFADPNAPTPAEVQAYRTKVPDYVQKINEELKKNTNTPDRYIGAITDATLKSVGELTAQKAQIWRDRNYGFAETPTSTIPSFKYEVKFRDTSKPNDPFNFIAADNPNASGVPVAQRQIELFCDPAQFNNFALGAIDSAAKERALIALATALCSRQAKYPSLYYLFPIAAHDRTSGQPGTEQYITPPAPYPVLPNEGFQVVNLAQIALQPKIDGNFTGGNTTTNWYLPTSTAANPAGSTDFQIATPGGGTRFVSLIDTAFYDGREAMTVRALNLDLNLLRQNSVGSDTWLTRSGVVYAFREDAVREDAISRPSNGALATPANATDVNNPRDPQLTDRGISAKPVDFYADPARRPYGFRLRNGQNLMRDVNNPRGLTFVSDNPVYIQGDFNFHSTNGTANNLEEFNTPLANNWGNFYTRNGLNEQFARVGSGRDTWRPAEILSDAITILSDNFAAGSIDLGIRTATTGTGISGDRYSYRSLHAPSGTNFNPEQGWVQEDGRRYSLTDPNRLPIRVSRNGNPFFCPNTTPAPAAGQPCAAPQEYTGAYRAIGSTNYGNAVNRARETRVNATLVSGVVPSRAGQTNGGFHNFPRFIEDWSGIAARITGSFVQLNFSTYATGPYEHDAWEPSDPDPATIPFSVNHIGYYQAPERAWGYDVGLQYAPAGPLAQRFVSSGVPRSEFYRDLRADDPYICPLRLALNRRDNRIDPASQQECN